MNSSTAPSARTSSGQLAGGEKLPSRRALAEHLNVSKITVETAYAQLLAEGYVTARQRLRLLCRAALRPPARGAAAARPGQAGRPRTARKALRGPVPVFRLGEADARRHFRRGRGAAPPDARRGSLCAAARNLDDLLRRRGMHVEPQQVYIGAGAEYFYHLLLEFFGRDRVYGLETLGHRKIARIYAASGVQCRAIAMDDDGVPASTPSPPAARRSCTSRRHTTTRPASSHPSHGGRRFCNG